jgi:transcriptional regulator with XRE-family HTH domain
MPNVSERQLNDALATFGKQVARLRASLNLSQEDFATKCGWDRTRQSKIESGSFNLTIESLIAIANASKMNLDINYSSR